MRPAPEVLAICQDRVKEKAFLRGVGVPVTPHWVVRDARELARALREHGGRAVLKTARLGYDGKGQSALEPDADVDAAWAGLGAEVGVLEAWVDFEREISVITARAADGAKATYPPVENQHREHILARTIAPAAIAPELAAAARALAERIAAALDVVGLLAVEMFVTRDGRLLVNELAPRPHNSGHWTIDACAISQFEQLVRAVCGLPLGAPEPFADAVMDNLLGAAIESWPQLLAEPGAPRAPVRQARGQTRPQARSRDAPRLNVNFDRLAPAALARSQPPQEFHRWLVGRGPGRVAAGPPKGTLVQARANRERPAMRRDSCGAASA